MNIYQTQFHAFVYRWTEISTGKWYIGSRTAKNCHVNDGYICSSKIVKPPIESNPETWSRDILCVGEPKFIVDLETQLLMELNAKIDPMSYNQHNGEKWSNAGNSHSDETKKRMSEARKGNPSPNRGNRKPHSDETKKRMSEARRGEGNPNCDKIIGGKSNYNRWHGDNCKHRFA